MEFFFILSSLSHENLKIVSFCFTLSSRNGKRKTLAHISEQYAMMRSNDLFYSFPDTSKLKKLSAKVLSGRGIFQRCSAYIAKIDHPVHCSKKMVFLLLSLNM